MKISDYPQRRSPPHELPYLRNRIEGGSVAQHGTGHPRKVSSVQPPKSGEVAIAKELTQYLPVASVGEVCLHACLDAIKGKLHMAMSEAREHAGHKRCLVTKFDLQPLAAPEKLGKA